MNLSRFISNSTVLTDAEEKQKEGRNYLVSAFFAAIFVAVVLVIWPDTLPFSYFELWHIKGGVGDWLYTAIPIFAWGAGFTFVVSMLTRNKPEENRNAEINLGKGFLLSLWAGVMEEICFRWLIFMSSIIGVKIVNFLIFGFLGLGIPELLQVYVLGPVANFCTLGYLEQVLIRPEAWAVGAGLLAANGFFRDGHKYLGIIGFVNSWFIGMFMFFLLFKYGLVACILVHFLYDLAIFAVRYVDQVIERAQGNR